MKETFSNWISKPRISYIDVIFIASFLEAFIKENLTLWGFIEDFSTSFLIGAVVIFPLSYMTYKIKYYKKKDNFN